MSPRPARIPLAAAVVALLGIGAWQAADVRAHVRDLEVRHAELGRALLDATEAVVVRECRGGRVAIPELRAALAATRETFGLRHVAVGTEAGGEIASAGTPPAAVDPRARFEKRFEPLRPNPWGRGPPRGGNSPLVELPRVLTLGIVTATDGLDARIAEARTHGVVTGAALGAAALLVAWLFWYRTRALALRADLAHSRAALEGLETLRRLGAGLAHETRNPLGVVRGFAERLAAGRIAPTDVPGAARAILEETDRTVARLDEFLLLSRPAALRRTRFPVRALFDELAALLRPDLDAVGATLACRCEGVELDADRDQVRRLLMNLVLNAVAAVDRGGVVELACETSSDGARIVVADDGAGVPAELRATLFEPYVTGRPGGTGLGLAIARRIALDHGFELRYEARSPRGTRMVLEAPRAARAHPDR